MSEKNTIHYQLKLKRTRTPMEVFAKLQKSVKKRGVTKNWCCTIDSENASMQIDFGDEKSETLRLAFDDKKCCEGFCKVYFPLSGELFDDEKKSEFKTLINMFYSAKSSFAEMQITDEYGIAESFLDSKVNKIILRELTEEETERAKRLFADGHTDIRSFITALLYDYRGLPYSEDFIPYINRHIGCNKIMFWNQNSDLADFFPAFVESFLCETIEYSGKGRLYHISDYYGELNGVYYAVQAWIEGIENITQYAENKSGMDPKGTQVIRLYCNKYLPLLEANASDYERCTLAYRFFVSTLDYLAFTYVGKAKDHNELIDASLADGVKAMLKDNDYDALEDALAEFWKKYGR